MKRRAGLLVDESGVTLAIVAGRGPAECFSFEPDDSAGAIQ